jgi:hypothetical protein
MTTIAYTIGRTTAYDQGLVENKDLHKLGRKIKDAADCPNDCPDGYPGGWVWKTLPEANRFLDSRLNEFESSWDKNDFSVYEIELTTDWDNGVSFNSENGIYNLLHDAKIIRKTRVS